MSTRWIAAISAGVTSIILILLFFTIFRFIVIKTNMGVTYKVDILTGKVLILTNGSEIPIPSEIYRLGWHGAWKPKERMLTSDEIRNLAGRARYSYKNNFSVTLYNGNEDILITDIEISITDKSENISRTYRTNVYIPPLETRDFSLSVLPQKKSAEFNWVINKAIGIPIEKSAWNSGCSSMLKDWGLCN